MGYTMKVQSEEEFLSTNGAPGGFGDPALHKNRGNNSPKMWAKIVNRQAKKDQVLFERRQELREKFKTLVDQGEIRPPTRQETMIDRANGHPDLESTQAARRICQKNGWKY